MLTIMSTSGAIATRQFVSDPPVLVRIYDEQLCCDVLRIWYTSRPSCLRNTYFPFAREASAFMRHRREWGARTDDERVKVS